MFQNQNKGGALYLIFFVTVTVIMILAMFIFYFCLKQQYKHCIRHYDCDYEKKIRYKYGPSDLIGPNSHN